MNSDAPTVLATIVLFSSIFLILYFLQYLVDDKVYADGLSQESLPPIGNRELSLFVKISPSILTPENVKNFLTVYLMRRTIELFSMSHTK